MNKSLAFRKDGTFKIIQFTDVHWKTGGEKDRHSLELMCRIIDQEQPDFIVYTGDVIQSKECSEPIPAFLQAISPAEERGIPWSYVFGNHDTEHGVTHKELMKAQQSMTHCLTEPGPDELSGVGNYVLPVYSADRRQANAVMYFFDSHMYAPAKHGKYAWIQRDQIAWYTQTSAALKAKWGQTLPALAFFHIPLPEYADMYAHGVTFGTKGEDVCAPVLNSGLFTAFVEMGDVIGTFAGHDHANDYWGEWHGIKLCYGRVSGYNTYPGTGQTRGARIIQLRGSQQRFDTWIRQDDGMILH